jgi:hypothetical protein
MMPILSVKKPEVLVDLNRIIAPSKKDYFVLEVAWNTGVTYLILSLSDH